MNKNKIDIDEILIAKIWENRDFKGSELHSLDGKKIEVLSVGIENQEEGADFRNAQIRIDGEIISGDIEIHVRSSDWILHKHQLNPKYDRVILHVVMWHDAKTLMTKKYNDERVPIVELCDQLSSDIVDIWQKYKSDGKGLIQSNPYLQYKIMDREKLARLLDEMGDLRFEEKVKRFEERLATKTFEQLIYTGLFEAAGYSKNRIPFLKLTKSIEPLDVFNFEPHELTAILLGCAGLLPSQNPTPTELKGEALKIANRFQKIWDLKRQQFNLDAIPRESWKLLKIRPNNSPIRRIIAISQILTSHGDKLFARLLESVNSNNSTGESEKIIKNLRLLLMPKASDFWERHFDFDKSSQPKTSFLIGENRADDIIINVVLPLLYLYARRKSDQALQNRINKFYSVYPKLQDNFITRKLETMIFEDKTESRLIVNSARRQQGLLQIYSAKL